MSNNAKPATPSNPFDIFVIGARKGFQIAINNLMPNVLMAYVIAEILNLVGAMQFIGKIFAPMMGIFGLPGDGVNGIFEALRTHQREVRFVQVRHEEAAAFAARPEAVRAVG